MADCECPQHLQPYLFRLRQSRSGTQLIEPLSRQGGWKDCGQGWQAREQPLALPGWGRNRWGWGGFVTQDLLRCQVAARNVALIYNWWSLFVRCAQPQRPREAVTSRPLLLAVVGRAIS